LWENLQDVNWLFMLQKCYISERTRIIGVFKQRLYLLISSPTSTERVAATKSNLSPRFTIKCLLPHSVWPLVVQLHPLNWARAQTVRLISDKVTMEEFEEQLVCVNFVINLVKTLQRYFNSLAKNTGRTVWADRSVMSGLNALRKAEFRSVKIPVLDEVPHQQTRTMSRDFVLWIVEIIFNSPGICWRCGHQHRIMPSNF